MSLNDPIVPVVTEPVPGADTVLVAEPQPSLAAEGLPSRFCCFVTGTDTGVGKTLVSAGLLHALAPHHRRVVGMKPVAAGVVPWGEDWASEDAIALRSASTLAVPPELDNPVLLLDPLSPHIAAERAGVQIDIAAIVRSYQALAAAADAVVVEGAGGFHVPYRHADLRRPGQACLPVVCSWACAWVASTMHAHAEAIRARGLTLGAGGQPVDPEMEAADETLLPACPPGRTAAGRHTPQELPDARSLVFELPGAGCDGAFSATSWLDEIPAQLATSSRRTCCDAAAWCSPAVVRA